MKTIWLLPVLALLSPMLFPWQVTLVFSIAASYVFPPTAVCAGFVIDTLYAPSVPYTGTLIGLGVTVLAVFVRSFVKRNIME